VTRLLERLAAGQPVIAAELRPPRAELGTSAGMDAWIDTYHAVRRLTRQGTFVFLTDNAVGANEEHNLRHLVANLGQDVSLGHVVPFLTAKHSLEYCLAYAERARQHGFEGLVVLGGDRQIGPSRCVEHGWQLRRAIREQQPDLMLGGWANPHADAASQVDYLLDEQFTGEFFLTQVVSHHREAPLRAFVDEARVRRVPRPGLFGVFYYRSANPRTLSVLSRFLPVPAEAITREFDAGATATEVCARTVRTLLDLGVRHIYISNLPLENADRTLAEIMERVGVTT
jgi:hypothetical protein